MASSDRTPSRRGPGRPSGGRIVEDHEILDAALAALATGGYSGLSVRGLARDLGVSLSTIQHRFPTKDLLWRAAVDHLLASEAGDLPAAGIDGLRSAVAAAIERSARYPGISTALLGDAGPGAPGRLAYVATRTAPRIELARAVFGSATATGAARAFDLDVLIALLMLGVGSLAAAPEALRTIVGLDVGHDQDRLVAGVLDILLFGLVTRDG